MEERKGNMELGPSMIINLRGRGWGWFWRFGFGWTRIVRGPRPSSGASLGFLVKGSGTQARHRVPSGVPAFCTNSGAARHRKQPCAGSGRHGEGQGNSFCSTCHKYVMRTSRDAGLGRDVGHAWLWQVPTARSWFNWWGPKKWYRIQKMSRFCRYNHKSAGSQAVPLPSYLNDSQFQPAFNLPTMFIDSLGFPDGLSVSGRT